MRQFAHLVVLEQRPDLRAILLAEGEHQDRGALRAGEAPSLGTRGLARRKRRDGAGDVVFGCRVRHGQVAGAGSASHWRRMPTVSFGLASASSPTLWTDCACTWPCTCATSIIWPVTCGAAPCGVAL